MKKITILAIMLASSVSTIQAQCNDDMPLPYEENFDAAIVPDLPDCTYSFKQSFVGNDWEAAVASNNNFTGNVARYSTDTEEGWSMNCSYVMRSVHLTAGMAYKVSYKYAHNDNEAAIYALRTTLFSNNPLPEIALASHEAITGTAMVNYSTEQFTVPTSDSYYLRFDIESLGNEGILYLDDIKIEEMGVMSTIDNTMRNIVCYPNPVKDILTITNTTALEKLELYNITGQLVLTQPATEPTSVINLENLPSGIYIVKAISKNSSIVTQLIRE